jgi:hypothetical protein
MSIKKRLERLESQSESKAEPPPARRPPEISAAAWMALFSDSDLGMTVPREEVVAARAAIDDWRRSNMR